MSPRAWQILSAVVLLSVATAAKAQNYQELKSMVSGPWHHVPKPTDELAFNREIAKCQVISAQTPVQSTTIAIVEIVRWRVIANCLKAAGYEPGTAPPIASQGPKPATLGTLKMAGKGPGISPCSQYTASLEDEKEEHVFFSWGEGFLTGYNLNAKGANLVELSAISPADQIRFVRAFCEKNPGKKYIEAMISLMHALREASTSK